MPRAGVSLRPLTTLGVGGPARWFVSAESPDHVRMAHDWSMAEGVPIFVLGGGSNLVIADEGFPGLVLQMAIAGMAVETTADGTRVTAGAGEAWDRVVASLVARGLSGVECLSGIPGTVGGTPIQNVGAYGQEVSEVIERVTAFDRTTASFVELGKDECHFAYRMSRFKAEDAGRFIVSRVTMRLGSGAPRVVYPDLVAELERGHVESPGLVDVRLAVLAVRRRKGMVLDPDDADTRSVGSFFMNPVVDLDDQERIAVIAGQRPPGFAVGKTRVKIPAAWLIERAGLRKGYVDGAVGISSKHPLAIVNRGGATTRDVLRCAGHIKRVVIDWCGVWLRPEPVFVGLDGDNDVEFLQKAHD